MKNKIWDGPADDKAINETIEALKNNGIDAEVFDSREEAKKRVLSLIPEGASVMDMSSVTLNESGISKEIKESGKWDVVKTKLASMDREKNAREIMTLGAAPDYAIGSVQAVTKKGELLMASDTGSQLPAYAYSAGKVIFVIGAQKIVNNIDEGMKRIYEYALPLESERAKKAYGVPGSNVSKILMINKEIQQGRIKVIFIKENIGF